MRTACEPVKCCSYNSMQDTYIHSNYYRKGYIYSNYYRKGWKIFDLEYVNLDPPRATGFLFGVVASEKKREVFVFKAVFLPRTSAGAPRILLRIGTQQ